MGKKQTRDAGRATGAAQRAVCEDRAGGPRTPRVGAGAEVSAATPLSNTGVNQGVPDREKLNGRARNPASGRLEAASLTSDPELRQYVGRIVEALDVLVPVLDGLVVGAHKRKDHTAMQGLASALVGLSALRAAVTGAGEREGVRFPVADHVAEVVQDVLFMVASQSQGAARMALADAAARVSHANGEEGAA